MKYCLPTATSTSYHIIIALTLIISTIKKGMLTSVNICRFSSTIIFLERLNYVTSDYKIHFTIHFLSQLAIVLFIFKQPVQLKILALCRISEILSLFIGSYFDITVCSSSYAQSVIQQFPRASQGIMGNCVQKA